VYLSLCSTIWHAYSREDKSGFFLSSKIKREETRIWLDAVYLDDCSDVTVLACIRKYGVTQDDFLDIHHQTGNTSDPIRPYSPYTGRRACGSNQASDDSRLTASRCTCAFGSCAVKRGPDATHLKKVLSAHAHPVYRSLCSLTFFQAPGYRHVFTSHSSFERFSRCLHLLSGRGSTL